MSIGSLSLASPSMTFRVSKAFLSRVVRTVELDANLYESGASIPWFYDIREPDFLAPLTLLLVVLACVKHAPQVFDSLSRVASCQIIDISKIGSQDAFAFPELLQGSIIRVNRLRGAFDRTPIGKTPARRLFLVEHSNGMTCSRMCRPTPNRVVPVFQTPSFTRRLELEQANGSRYFRSRRFQRFGLSATSKDQ